MYGVKIILVSIGVAILLHSYVAGVNDKAGEEINWQVISGGGSINGISANYILSGTLGQTATGTGSFASYAVLHGFWQGFEGSGGNCCIDWGLPGDANDDMAINLLDVLQIIAFVYQDPIGEPPNPHGCDALMDCNGDGPDLENPTINLLDILAMIEHVYQEPMGEPALCCPPGCQVH